MIDHAAIPEKFSATILEFGAPLLGDPGTELPHAVMKDALTFIIALWNALAMALPAWGHPEHLEELRTMLDAPNADTVREIFEALCERRDKFYRLDARVVGDWELTDDPEVGRKLRCETRLPEGVTLH